MQGTHCASCNSRRAAHHAGQALLSRQIGSQADYDLLKAEDEAWEATNNLT
jgi:hypothetical protein